LVCDAAKEEIPGALAAATLANALPYSPWKMRSREERSEEKRSEEKKD
jgi:hypothetical protein